MSSGQQRGRAHTNTRGDNSARRGRPAPRGHASSAPDADQRGGRGGGARVRAGHEARGRGEGAERGGRGSRGGSDGAERGGRGARGGRDQRGSRGARGGDRDRPLPIRGGPQGGAPPIEASDNIYLSGIPPSAPEAVIRAKEDALVAQTRGKQIDGFPGRHSYGTNGRQIVLRTNYLAVETAFEAGKPEGEKTLYRYTVDAQPEPSRPKRKQLMQQIVKQPLFNGVTWATDYGRLIVTTKELDFGDQDSVSMEILIRSRNDNDDGQVTDEEPAPDFVLQARNRNTVRVTITFTRSYNLRDLIQYLQSESSGALYADRGDVIQLLNIIISKPPSGSTTVANVGQNRFYPFGNNPLTQSFELGSGLQALRGFCSSIRPTVNRLLLNLNPTSGAFYIPMPLLELWQEFKTNEQFESFLHRLKVEAKYVKDKQQQPFMTKTKTIVGFAKQLTPPTFRVKRFGSAREVKFSFVDQSVPNAQPQTISVAEYFLRYHSITLRQPDLPVLNTGTRTDPQYMPLELCAVLPGQPYRRLLPADQTSKMISFAARYPHLNALSIAGTPDRPGEGLQLFRLAGTENEDNPQATSVQPFGLRTGTSLITVPARILNSPSVVYANKPAYVNGASWNLAGLKFLKGGEFSKWKGLVINIDGPRGSAWAQFPPEFPTAESLFDKLSNELSGYGIRMGTRLTTHDMRLRPLNDSNRAINNRILSGAFQTAKDEGVDILFVILPAYDRWLYARIKLYGDTTYGIHTVNAIGTKFQKPRGLDMFIGNLALKFNVKGGGISHNIPETLLKPVGKNTMLFGIDVTHPSPGSSEGAPSIACVVANTDENLFQWPGSIRTQTGRVEMVEGLKEMVLERLRLWQNKHRVLPDNIVVYRDGVSEGQFHLVLQRELPCFEDAYREMYGAHAKWPKTAIIIVGKRHHTRFYPTRPQDADVGRFGNGNYNTLPGTVVDRGITGRVIHEFFLQPHQGLKGTVRPAHYSVIKDDVGFTANQLERLTLNLCYYFVRCTKAVSICPPAYYADLLAERGRAYLFSTLQESHGSESSVFDGASAEWTGGVHPKLRESTWYI